MKKRYIILFSLIVLLTLVSPIVSAQDDFLSKILGPFKGIDILNTYKDNYLLFDFILTFIFFLAIAQHTIGKRFGEGTAPSKSITAVFAIALSIGLVFFMRTRPGLYCGDSMCIGDIGPYVGMLVMIVIGYSLYDTMVKYANVKKSTAGAAVYLLMFAIANAIISEFFTWLDSTTTGGFLYAMLWLLVIISAIMLVIGVFGVFGGMARPGGTASAARRRVDEGLHDLNRAARRGPGPESSQEEVERAERTTEAAQRRGEIAERLNRRSRRLQGEIERLEQIENIDERNALQLLGEVESSLNHLRESIREIEGIRAEYEGEIRGGER